MPRVPILCVIAVLLTTNRAVAESEERDSEQASAAESGRAVFAAPVQDESWKQDALVALIGGGARFRRMHFDVGDGMGGSEPRDFDTGAYFDFAWHLFIRPLGHRSPRPAMRAMVLQLDGGAGINLEVESVDSGISLDTNTWRMIGQLGYLYPMKRWQLGGMTGIGGDVFNIDLNSLIPSSRIVYLRLGPSAIAELLGDFLFLRVDFGLRFPFHLGEIDNTFGHDTRAFGLDSTLTFQGRVEAGFTYAFRFVWEYFGYRFRGPVDDVPAMAEGGSGRDHAIDFQLLLGWSL